MMTVLSKFYFSCHDVTRCIPTVKLIINAPENDSIIGEYINVTAIMCHRYMDRFPAERYTELEECFDLQYMVSIGMII